MHSLISSYYLILEFDFPGEESVIATGVGSTTLIKLSPSSWRALHPYPYLRDESFTSDWRRIILLINYNGFFLLLCLNLFILLHLFGRECTLRHCWLIFSDRNRSKFIFLIKRCCEVLFMNIQQNYFVPENHTNYVFLFENRIEVRKNNNIG